MPSSWAGFVPWVDLGWTWCPRKTCSFPCWRTDQLHTPRTPECQTQEKIQYKSCSSCVFTRLHLYVGEQLKTVYLVLLRGESSCCGDLLQLRRRLLPEDSLQQHKDVCRLWRCLQQHCQATVPEKAKVVFDQRGISSSVLSFTFLSYQTGATTWDYRTRRRVTGSGRTSSPEGTAGGRPRCSQEPRRRCHSGGSTGSPPSLIWGVTLMRRNWIKRGEEKRMKERDEVGKREVRTCEKVMRWGEHGVKRYKQKVGS